MSYILLILLTLTLSTRIVQIYGQTTISQTIGDNVLYAACGKLCDKPDMDAIAPLNVETDKEYMVTIVRDGLCSWILDMNEPKQNRDWGRRHHFKYDIVESLFTIFDDPESSKKLNMTALFTTGMVGEVWRSVDGYIKKDSDGPLPLLGLGYNMQQKIDASFGWQPDSQSRIVKIIQNDSYYSYDLTAKRRLSGPDSLTEDFSYNYKKLGKIQGAFTRGKDIYFFSGKNGYYIWKSEDGKTGVLSKKMSVTQDFYNCGTRYTTPKTDSPQEENDFSETVGDRDYNFLDKEGDSSGKTTEFTSSTGSDEMDTTTRSEEVSTKNTISSTVSPKTETTKTSTPKVDAGAEKPVGGANHRVLLSVKLSIILTLISILDKIFK